MLDNGTDDLCNVCQGQMWKVKRGAPISATSDLYYCPRCTRQRFVAIVSTEADRQSKKTSSTDALPNTRNE